MRDTGDIRQKMLGIWNKVEKGDLTHQEARVYIGLARTILDTLKVEIAAAHLSVDRGSGSTPIPAVNLVRQSGRKAIAA